MFLDVYHVMGEPARHPVIGYDPPPDVASLLFSDRLSHSLVLLDPLGYPGSRVALTSEQPTLGYDLGLIIITQAFLR